MLHNLFAVLFFSFCCTAPVALAGDAEENDLYAELQVNAYVGTNNADGYMGKQLYVEKTISKGYALSMYGVAYHDEEFEEGQIGIAKKIADVQVAIGIGTAHYDEGTHTVISPWIYYDKDTIRAMILAEFYSNDSDTFVKGFIQKDVGETFFVGIYGETEIGVGPQIGLRLTEKAKVWVTVPVVDKGDVVAIVGLSIAF